MIAFFSSMSSIWPSFYYYYSKTSRTITNRHHEQGICWKACPRLWGRSTRQWLFFQECKTDRLPREGTSCLRIMLDINMTFTSFLCKCVSELRVLHFAFIPPPIPSFHRFFPSNISSIPYRQVNSKAYHRSSHFRTSSPFFPHLMLVPRHCFLSFGLDGMFNLTVSSENSYLQHAFMDGEHCFFIVVEIWFSGQKK